MFQQRAHKFSTIRSRVLWEYPPARMPESAPETATHQHVEPRARAALADVRAGYEARRAHWEAQAARHDRRMERLGSARLLVFFTGLLLAIWVLRSHPGLAPWLLLPVGLFVALLVWHAQARAALASARRGAAYHERNLARLDGRWAGAGPTGERHAPESHLYARDLDVVGEGSLFQLLCTTRSRCGEAALARWLLAPAGAAEIRARQAAVAALAPDSDLRERLALAGDDAGADAPGGGSGSASGSSTGGSSTGGSSTGGSSDVDPEALAEWVAAEPVRFTGVERGIAVALGALAAAAAVGWALGLLPLLPLVLVATVEAVYAQALKRRMQRVDALAAAGARALPLLAQLLALLEERARAPGAPPALAALGTAVGASGARGATGATAGASGQPASAAIARFDALARSLEAGVRNGVYALFAFLLQLRVHRAHALEGWRAEVAPALPGWLVALGEFEALLALATFAHEHPGDIYPELVAPAACFDATGLGHPLLPEESCVRNDVALDGARALLLISGSNMSGKSTLLRAVGLAAVMAGAGAPVRARTLRLAPVHVGACIAIHDSLREGASRFWAEITRLRAVAALAQGGRPTLFLLDELLSGTNSHDRLLGARAVLRQLLAAGAIGIVTTHDLALAQLADELAPRAANAHFEDGLRDGVMVFDYRMRPGVVQRGNALALMRSLGLEV
jgi:hypothetical protein